MEIELTSKQSDGTWTWRAAGAKLPKGSLDGSLLSDTSSVGDIIRVETEQFVDGISVKNRDHKKRAETKEAQKIERGPHRRNLVEPEPSPLSLRVSDSSKSTYTATR